MAKHTKRRGVRKSRKSVKGGRGTRRQRGGKIYKYENGNKLILSGKDGIIDAVTLNAITEFNHDTTKYIPTMFRKLDDSTRSRNTIELYKINTTYVEGVSPANTTQSTEGESAQEEFPAEGESAQEESHAQKEEATCTLTQIESDYAKLARFIKLSTYEDKFRKMVTAAYDGNVSYDEIIKPKLDKTKKLFNFGIATSVSKNFGKGIDYDTKVVIPYKLSLGNDTIKIYKNAADTNNESITIQLDERQKLHAFQFAKNILSYISQMTD